MKKQFLFLLLSVILLSSCATATLSEFPGVGRVKQYDFYSYDIPPAFDGFRIGFASDFHYESRFKRSELNSAVRALKSMHADVLLLGGDYRGKKGGNLDTLFTALSRVYTPYGTFAVMGNHDYGYCYSEVVEAMQKNHVRLMENKSYKLMKDGQYIICLLYTSGAGKTTASYTVLPEILECREFVNADEIAKGLSPFNP